jgi:transposase
MFQQPHTPESNPIEQVWQYFKRGLRWELPKNLDELRSLISKQLEQLTKEVIKSIVGRAYILEALSVVNV